MTPQVSAFRWVPPFAQGLVRDLRVRWALHEAGEAYSERLIGASGQGSEDYRRLQPFGQVPAYEEDGLALFESGAIVLQIAERTAVLMPQDAHGRARARTWVFAALNTVEPPIMFLNQLEMMQVAQSNEIRSAVEAAVRRRLANLAEWLEGHDYLEGSFSAGDLLMTSVLRILRTTDMVEEFPVLKDYKARCEARAPFQRALADQLATFDANAPAAG
jgi:glutathione S-transferase